MVEKIIYGEHTFEIVDSVPRGYQIWNIGKNMIDGYLPLVEVGGHDGYAVNTDTMKAIKIDDAQVILSAVGRGQYTIKQMETYIKRHKKSKNMVTLRHVEKLEKALEVMHRIKWQ